MDQPSFVAKVEIAFSITGRTGQCVNIRRLSGESPDNCGMFVMVSQDHGDEWEVHELEMFGVLHSVRANLMKTGLYSFLFKPIGIPRKIGEGEVFRHIQGSAMIC